MNTDLIKLLFVIGTILMGVKFVLRVLWHSNMDYRSADIRSKILSFSINVGIWILIIATILLLISK